jgi:FkbM family methyltransferase
VTVWLLNRLARTPRAARALFAMVAFHDHWRDNVSEEVRFLAFCAGLRQLGHGQVLEDLWVLFETDLQPGGYFVEFGAYDAVVHSNTWLLEDRFGWTGLLAEPNPELAEGLRRSRKAVVDDRCVWDVSGKEVELLVAGDAELSTVAAHATPDLHSDTRVRTKVATVAVPTVSLDDLLDEHGAPEVIDFLSVDTEGTELRILQSFDFSRHRPRLIAVEHNGRSEAERELDALMLGQGYERRFPSMSGWDAWYRLRT